MSEQYKLYGDGIHDDTAALQFLLDNNDGTVVLKSGTYLVSDTLYLHDDTHLILSHKATVRLADDACCILLANDQWTKSGRNRNIIVEGGTWDGNNLHQRRGKVYDHKPYYFGILMRFEGIEDLTVRNLTIKDPEAFSCQIKDADRFTVENITFDHNMAKPNMDGIHVQGPSRNGYIRNIKGATNDDLVALNCDDIYDNWDDECMTHGEIENVVIDGLYADNGFTAVRLLSCGSRLENVTIRNIFGTYRLYGVSFTQWWQEEPGAAPAWINNVFIDGVYCTKQPQDPPVDRRFIDALDKFYGEGCHEECIQHADLIWFQTGVNCGNVSISNLSRVEKTVTQAYTIHVDPGASVETLTLQNVTQTFLNCPERELLKNEGTIDRLIDLTGDLKK